MTAWNFHDWLKQKPLIGMVHLAPLPGSPRGTDLDAVIPRALADAEALAGGGCDALMLENFGDAPFFPGSVPAATVAGLTRVATEIRQRYNLPIGINVLRNDGEAALAVAAAVAAQFIRVTVLVGARVTDQGLVTAVAATLLRSRRALGVEHIRILADVDVKHSAPLAPRDLADEVEETLGRGLADAVVISGSGTGRPVDLERAEVVRRAAAHHPVFIGSGVTPSSLPALWPWADAFIVGTSLKASGDVSGPVDLARVKALVAALEELRS